MYTSYAAKVMQSGREYYWSPLGECGKDMGLNSLFAALSVMYQSYHRDKKVLLHCHAGANRSPTAYACFHYMMTGTHLGEKRDENGLIWESNMLLYNCNAKHLPHEEWMKIWLTRLKAMFDDFDRYIGGMFDWSVDFSRALKTKL